MNRCVVITSWQSAPLNLSFDFRDDDYIICADGGYAHAKAAGLHPRMVVGDFDSADFAMSEKDLPVESGCRILRAEAEKDDTDTMLCLKCGIEQGFDEFYAIGGLGGRLDHTVANLQTMACAVDQNKTIWFFDGKNRATLRNPGRFTLAKAEGRKLSLFSYGEACCGLTVTGVKYPLRDYCLNNSFPLGVSNEFLDEAAEISHTAGKLLLILSRD
jgi:thiamine pyrophosphokinase